MKSKLLNYTTNVPVEKSILDIERLLMKVGARRIIKDASADGRITAFIFSLELESGTVLFRLPCEVERVASVLLKSYKRPRHDTAKKIKLQAERVAWRILLDWIEAQTAMIMLEQTKPQQIFLPYAYDIRTGQTLFEKVEKSNFQFMLTDGN